MASVEWFYAKSNKQYGPVSASDLKRLAQSGELGSGDLVWREGLGEWMPARKVKGLFDDDAPPAAKAVPAAKAARASAKAARASPQAAPVESTPPTFEKSPAAFARAREGTSRHLFDFGLELARASFTARFVDSTSKIFTLCGHYGLYLAMLVLFGFSLLLGVKTNRLNTILVGIAGVVILFVLQYAASRFSGALERLNRTTTGKMSSPAFLDCYALLHVIGGVVVLLGLTVMAVQTGILSLVLPAIVSFILCQYVAVIALNPETLNLTIAPDTGAGEEAIGVLSFFVKLGLRIVPVAFGVGVAWGTLTLLYACVLVFFPPEGREGIEAFVGPERFQAMALAVDGSLDEAMKTWPAEITASTARMILIGFAALPFVMYVCFLFWHLLIDVLRALLSLPGKLDGLGEIRDSQE